PSGRSQERPYRGLIAFSPIPADLHRIFILPRSSFQGRDLDLRVVGEALERNSQEDTLVETANDPIPAAPAPLNRQPDALDEFIAEMLASLPPLARAEEREAVARVP